MPAPNKSSRSRSKVAYAAAQRGQAGQETAGDVGVGPGFEQECVDLGGGFLPGSGCWCPALLRAPGAARLDRVGQPAAGCDLSSGREVECGGGGQHQVVLTLVVEFFVGLPDLARRARSRRRTTCSGCTGSGGRWPSRSRTAESQQVGADGRSLDPHYQGSSPKSPTERRHVTDTVHDAASSVTPREPLSGLEGIYVLVGGRSSGRRSGRQRWE
jgi:hypothetical protein